jgi:hypothetical protein
MEDFSIETFRSYRKQLEMLGKFDGRLKLDRIIAVALVEIYWLRVSGLITFR